MRRAYSADAILLVCVVLWGLNFSAMKYALKHGFAPLAFSAVRYGIATFVFVALMRVMAGERHVRTSRRDLLVMVVAGAVGIGVNQVAFIQALRLTTASTMALVVATMPIFASLVSRERHGLRHWLAAALSFGGVSLVALGAGGGLSGELGGVLLGLVAPATWAAFSTALQPLLARLSTVRVNAVSSLAACVPLFVVASPQLAGESWGEITSRAWLALLFASLAALAFTNILWFAVVERIGTARASIYVNLSPFLGALFAVVLLSESLGALQIAGGAVIAGGIVLARWRGSLEPPAE